MQNYLSYKPEFNPAFCCRTNTLETSQKTNEKDVDYSPCD